MRDWQNLFAVTSFRYNEVLFNIFYYYCGKENSSLYRALRHMEVPLYKLLSQFQRLTLLRLRAVSYYYYFFSHKRSRAEEKYLKFAAFYFLNFTWLCHGSFRLCRTYGGMHVNWKSFFNYSRGGVWIFLRKTREKQQGSFGPVHM